MRRTILKSSMLLLLFGLNGCASKPPDFPICVEMGLDRGECIKVMSGEKIHVHGEDKLYGKTWWESRPTNLIIPKESWVEIKKWIINFCKRNQGSCDKEVSSWERSIESVDSQLEEKGVSQ